MYTKIVPLLVACVCLAIGYWLGKGAAPVVEDTSPAEEITQPDGSLVLERTANTEPDAAPHITTGEELRRISTVVQPDLTSCEPVEVVTSIVRNGNSVRVVSSAVGGQVLSGHDLVIEPLLTPPEPFKWAAGASIEPFRELYGIWGQLTFGRLVTGVAVQQTKQGDAELRVTLGINF